MTKSKWYSPQLSREIVSRLYFKAKGEGIRMTFLANQNDAAGARRRKGSRMQARYCQ